MNLDIRGTVTRYLSETLGVLLGVAACSAPMATQPVRRAAPDTSSRHGSTTRQRHWVPLPVGEASTLLSLGSGQELSIRDGLRVRTTAQGVFEVANEVLPGVVSGVQLPARLGPGFLFWSNVSGETALWRSDTWTSALIPLTRVPDAVESVVPGFDRLYLLRSQTHELLAIDPASGEQVDLGPLPEAPAFNALAFLDANVAAIAVDVQGLLVTVDGGKTWQSTDVYDANVGLKVTDRRIDVSSSKGEYALTSLGKLLPREETLTRLATTIPGFGSQDAEPTAPDAFDGHFPLLRAVLNGVPTPRQTALVVAGGQLSEVRLSDGAVLYGGQGLRGDAQPCVGTQLGKGYGFVCTDAQTGTRILSLKAPETEGGPYSLEPLAEFSTPRFVSSSANGALVVRGGCQQGAPSAGGSGVYCIMNPASNPREIAIAGDLGAERVVALSNGEVWVVVPPRLGSPGRLTILAQSGKTDVALELPKTNDDAEFLKHGLWLDGLTQSDANTVATWVAGADQYVGIRIDRKGHVTLGKVKQGDLRRAVLAGPRALELSAGGVGWFTEDHGGTWQELPLPRGLGPLNFADTGVSSDAPKPVVGCSPVGCAYGPWLLLPTTAHTGATEAQADARAAPTPGNSVENPVQYSDWRLHCYPTGERVLGSATAPQPELRAQRGFVVGFGTSSLAVSSQATEIDSTANRPFLGVRAPAVPSGFVAFDMGADAENQFRAYGWGLPADGWRRTSRWLVRVADRFSLDGVWSTAPTWTPWLDYVTAAQTFGADRANRHVANWQYESDADETSGVVRIATGTGSELHFVGRGQPISSVSGIAVGNLLGVARIEGRWYFGTRDGNSFRIYAVDALGAQPFATLPVHPSAAVTLVRSVDAGALGIAVRTRRGTLHVFPLDDTAKPLAPLVVSRAQANRRAPTCEDGTSGWLLQAPLPPSRMSASEPSNLIEFMGQAEEWRAQSVTGRFVLSAQGICLDAIAAQVSTGEAQGSPARALPPQADSVRLVATDRSTDARYGFRCLP